MAKLKTFRERLRDNDFPDPAPWKSDADVADAYSQGFPGAFPDPESDEELEAGEFGNGADVLRDFGLEGSGAGKLTCLWPAVWRVAKSNTLFQGDVSQPVGDCVSRSQTHAAMLSLAVAVENGHGSWPELKTPHAQKMGFHPHGVYALRGHGGHGWSCSAAALKSKTIGLVEFGNYASPANWDLSAYSAGTSTHYGSRSPSSDVIQQLGTHRTLDYTVLRGFEQVRDALSSGFGVSSCGGEGFSKTRDGRGVSRRSGHWSHGFAYIGVDDSEWAHKNGGPFIACLNSWGRRWISGPKATQGNPDLPPLPDGAWWATWSDVSRRSTFGITTVKGFPQMKLKPWREQLGGLI